jgi:predicted  nucleic acid-binding Zn-ribbon protein
MNDIKRQQTDKLLVHLDNLERYLGSDKERENQDLRATIQEIRDRYEETLLYKEDCIRGLNEQIEELQTCLQSFQKSNRGNENQIDDLRRENNHLKDSLIEKLAQDIDDELINREIRKVKDPSSFSALKAILSRIAKIQADADSAAQELQSVHQLKSKVTEGGAKQKELSLEIKSLRKKVEQLNTQNEFLLGELDFSRKKLQEGKGRVQKQVPQNSQPQTGDNSRALLDEVLPRVQPGLCHTKDH